MSISSKRLCNLVSVLMLGIGSVYGNAQAAVLSGVDFDIVYDSNLTGLYGTPILSGNTVFFTPVNFVAQSLNGAGLDVESSAIHLQIIAHNNSTIASLSLIESGDYKLRGENSYVAVGGQTSVTSIDNSLVDSVPVTSTSDFTLKDGLTHDWDSSSFISLSATKWQGISSINYTIDNQLSAYTQSDDVGRKLAFIEKKFAGSSISLTVTTEVPEAETYAMLLAGLGVLGFVKRQKGRKS
jgi:hypothetical protein